MNKELLLSQIKFEFDSFIDYANMNLDPSNREDQIKLELQDKLKSSIINKLDKLSEVNK